ncbi:MAG: hypothetical protein ACREVS_19840 [Burkholderiales bacterium]
MYLWPRTWIAAALKERERKAEGRLLRLAEWVKRLLAPLFG